MSDKRGTMDAGAGDKATELVETKMTADSLQLTAYGPDEDECESQHAVEGHEATLAVRK